jgi:hypothetical protein
MQPGEHLLIETLELQTSGLCYDVAFYRDGILYLKPGEEIVYLAPMDGSNPAQGRPLFTNKDISCSPAALSFSGDYSRGYFTMPVEGDNQQYMEKIFELSIDGDEVLRTEQAAFTMDASRNLHPAVSTDASLMVFSSDRLPTSGGLDLFFSRLTDDGWSSPQNLGESINTSGHEWFPFLDRMNNLWFSSTGHSGYGGFDIYFCPFNGTGWDLPRNLGLAINSPNNEVGFSIHPQRQMALFSRSQPAESKGIALKINLHEEFSSRDISIVLQGMANPVNQTVATVQAKPQSTPEPEAKPEPEPEPEPIVNQGTDEVVFRVQIISSLYENSFPTVLIEGSSYNTHEYFYMGSFRITVGKFASLEEANAFRLKCLDSGFKQAFVAAFRGGKRETDPSVFKQ